MEGVYYHKKSPWDRIFESNNYDISSPDPLVEILLNRFGSLRKGFALDLGCGRGRHIPVLKEFFTEVVALDISEVALMKGIDRFNIKYAVNGDMKSLPFVSSFLDCVLAWRVLHLGRIDEIKKTFGEIKRVLKKGGLFIGSVRNTENALFYLLSNSEKILEENTFKLQLTEELDGTVYHFFTDKELIDLLRGLKTVFFEKRELEHTRYTRHSGYKNLFTVFVSLKE